MLERPSQESFSERQLLIQAAEIAKIDLRTCIDPNFGFLSGIHQFAHLWGRDSLLAAMAGTRVGMHKTAKQTILTFLNGQQEDGFIPYRLLLGKRNPKIYRYGHLLKQNEIYVEKYNEPEATIRSPRSFGARPWDGMFWTIIAAKDYSDQSIALKDYFDNKGDEQFLADNYPRLKKAADYCLNSVGYGKLLEVGPYSGWADSTLKFRITLTGNVLLAKAMQDMGDLYAMIEKEADNPYLEKAEEIKKLIDKKLWNGVFLADWFDYKRQDYFSTHANMLALTSGIALPERITPILNYAASLRKDFTLETNYPKYPWWRVHPFDRLVGMKDYHNQGLLWHEPALLFAWAQITAGDKQAAIEPLLLVAEKVIEYDQFHEVYERDGQPVNRKMHLGYKFQAEFPFPRAAALCILALNAYQQPIQ